MRVITFSVFAFLAVFAQAEKRLAGAHVHGLNYVQIISDGSTLQVNYEFPIAQLQEHDEHKDDEHKDDEHKHEEHEHDEHENVEDIAHLHVELKDMDNILEFIRLPDSAECTQKTINQSVKNVVAGEETNGDSGHKDVLIEALLVCRKPGNITFFDFTPAFEKFADLEEIEVEGVIENRSLSDMVSREKVLSSI
tara:strand:+ start:1165 stop:1746 length:582 start_codon:yes stop_codon:yes gene_type:complete